MDPVMMQQAIAAMNQMSPAQIANMQRQMASMSPSDLNSGVQAFQQMSADQQRQIFSDETARMFPGSTTQTHSEELQKAQDLKQKGNSLHSSEQYQEAEKQYQAALTVLSGVNTKSADNIRKACNLNLASCYLKTDAHGCCVETCNEILKSDIRNVKALFRRGQALHAQGKRREAVQDLKLAVQYSPDADRGLIQARLDSIQKEDPSESCEADKEKPQMSKNVANSSSETQIQAERDIKDQHLRAGASSTLQPQRGPEPPRTEWPAMNAENIESASKMLADMSPEDTQAMARAMQRVNANQTPEEQTAAMFGDPAVTRAALKMMGSMPPEEAQRMFQTLQQSGRPAAGPSQIPADMSALRNDPGMMKMMQDPEMMKSMQTMMGNLSADDLVSLSKQSGFDISKDQAAQMQEQMQKLSPQQMEKIIKFATGMQRFVAAVRSHKMLCLSLLLLVLAIIWRVFFAAG